MSGCFPTTPKDCHCQCHSLGIPIIKTSYPALACCLCDIYSYTFNETLSFCEHGRPIKFGCSKCYFKTYDDNEMNEQNASPMVQQMQELEKRIKELENSNQQIREAIMFDDRLTSKDIIERIEKLEAFEEDGDYAINDLRDKVKELENNVDFKQAKELIFHGAETHASILKCEHAIKKLDQFAIGIEKTISELVDKIAEIANRAYATSDVPHKCPVCNGWGKQQYFIKETLQHDIVDCNGCNSKGIIWG